MVSQRTKVKRLCEQMETTEQNVRRLYRVLEVNIVPDERDAYMKRNGMGLLGMAASALEEARTWVQDIGEKHGEKTR